MGLAVPGEMVGDARPFENRVAADHLAQLRTLVGPVQPGRDQNQDLVLRHPAGRKLFDERRQQGAVWNGSGDVADQDTGCFAGAGEVPQRPAGSAAPKRLAQPLHRVGRNRHRLFTDRGDEQVLRQLDGELAAAI